MLYHNDGWFKIAVYDCDGNKIVDNYYSNTNTPSLGCDNACGVTFDKGFHVDSGRRVIARVKNPDETSCRVRYIHTNAQLIEFKYVSIGCGKEQHFEFQAFHDQTVVFSDRIAFEGETSDVIYDGMTTSCYGYVGRCVKTLRWLYAVTADDVCELILLHGDKTV